MSKVHISQLQGLPAVTPGNSLFQATDVVQVQRPTISDPLDQDRKASFAELQGGISPLWVATVDPVSNGIPISPQIYLWWNTVLKRFWAWDGVIWTRIF